MDENDKVTFEKEDQYSARLYSGESTSRIGKWIIRHSSGLVKNGEQAGYVLLALVVFAVLVSLLLFFSIGTTIEEENMFNPGITDPDIITKENGAILS